MCTLVFSVQSMVCLAFNKIAKPRYTISQFSKYSLGGSYYIKFGSFFCSNQTTIMGPQLLQGTKWTGSLVEFLGGVIIWFSRRTTP